jgi:hypothetical protein
VKQIVSLDEDLGTADLVEEKINPPVNVQSSQESFLDDYVKSTNRKKRALRLESSQTQTQDNYPEADTGDKNQTELKNQQQDYVNQHETEKNSCNSSFTNHIANNSNANLKTTPQKRPIISGNKIETSPDYLITKIKKSRHLTLNSMDDFEDIDGSMILM